MAIESVIQPFLPLIVLAATEKQAVNRCHRLGQDRPVTVVKYVMEGTMEQRLHLLRNPTNPAEEVFDGFDELDQDQDGEGEGIQDDEEEREEKQAAPAPFIPALNRLQFRPASPPLVAPIRAVPVAPAQPERAIDVATILRLFGFN